MGEDYRERCDLLEAISVGEKQLAREQRLADQPAISPLDGTRGRGGEHAADGATGSDRGAC